VVTGHPELDGVVVDRSLADAVRDSDAAVVVTEWPEVAEIVSADIRASMRTPLIVDGRNFLDREAVRVAGFEYEGIGRA
jgi:UDPglucose 6-dehydrogenase